MRVTLHENRSHHMVLQLVIIVHTSIHIRTVYTHILMDGKCRMAGVAVTTPTLPVPHQHLWPYQLRYTIFHACFCTFRPDGMLIII